MSDRRRRTSRSRFRGGSIERRNKNKEPKKEKGKEKEKEKEERERSREKELLKEKQNKSEEILEIKSDLESKGEHKVNSKKKDKEKEKEKVLNNIELNSNSSSTIPKVQPDAPSIKLNKEKLLKLLKCPLCKGFYRTPYTINECMHTFCRSCIFKYFGSSVQRETCPVCETKIGGRPMDSLIFDNYLDSLLNILFPKFEEIDKENISLLYKTFREVGTPLPGDEEEAKMKMPTLKIFIMPENNKENKFKGGYFVPKNFNVESLKLLIQEKMKEKMKQECDVDIMCVKYKDKELENEMTMEVIDSLYGFDQDKTTFYYSFNKKGKE